MKKIKISGILIICIVFFTSCNVNPIQAETTQNQSIVESTLDNVNNSSTEIEEDLTESDLNDTDYEDESTELGWEYHDLGVKINADKKSGTCGENLTWTFGDGVLTISGTGDMVDWEFEPIWTLSYGDEHLKEVIIEEGVTSIGNRAFGWEGYLERIQIPSSVKRIGDSAFTDCEALKSIEIPEQVTKLEDSFDGCKSLKTITIPKNVKIIEDEILILFNGCLDLEEIYVDKDNSVYTSEDGVLFNKEKTKLIRYPSGKRDTSYQIPSGVTEIENYAFMTNFYLKDIAFPTSLIRIGECVFENNTKLKNAYLSDNIVNIGDNAFSGCENLTEVVLPKNIKKIEDGTFYGCEKLKTITIPKSVESIEPYVFSGCVKLKSIKVDKENAHYISKIGVLFTKDTTKLVAYPAGERNDAYTVPSGVKEIADGAFFLSKHLKKISFPNSLVSIGEGAFRETGLTSLHLPDSVTDVGRGAFLGCDNLEKATLSKGMKKVKVKTFAACYSLSDVYIPDTIEKIDKSAFPDNRNIHFKKLHRRRRLGEMEEFRILKTMTIFMIISR